MKKTKPKLLEQIDTTVLYHIDRIAYPIKGTITKVYSDNKHVDIQTKKGTLTYAEAIGNPVKGNTGVILFLENSNDEYIIIT